MPAFPTRTQAVTASGNAALRAAPTSLQGSAPTNAKTDHVHADGGNHPTGAAHNLAANGDWCLTFPTNTSAVLNFRGSDGVVRTLALGTLA